MVIEIGRLCVKLAGRDAGKECLIVDELKNNLVLIDGNTRRRKCNINHLELLPQKATIKKDASHDEVVKALEKLGIKVREIGKKFPKKEKKEKKEEKKPFISLPFKKKPLLEKAAPKEDKKEEKPKAKKPAKKKATKKKK
jgi:large subunit ribosomal protein L14e